ncbi:MAG: hypothetical protein N3H31_03185 [Candidatus Nezhaarchaeota archaeon]|nr:hypothetical protein [Candidatus Nezhaarchaeota archaeon]
MVALKEADPCPRCGGLTEGLRSRSGARHCGAEEEWLSLKRESAVFEAKGFRFKAYGAKVEIRETSEGVAIELLD